MTLVNIHILLTACRIVTKVYWMRRSTWRFIAHVSVFKQRFSRNITDILPLENVSTPTLLFPTASNYNGTHARTSDVGASLASLILK